MAVPTVAGARSGKSAGHSPLYALPGKARELLWGPQQHAPDIHVPGKLGRGRVPCQNSSIAADLAFLRSLGCCPAVFADQAAKDLSALDPGGDIDGAAWLTQRRFLLQALVRTVAVVMLSVLGQDVAQMPLAEDQHVVQALAAQRAHEALGV